MMRFAKKYQVHPLEIRVLIAKTKLFSSSRPCSAKKTYHNSTSLTFLRLQLNVFLTVLHSSEYMHEEESIWHLINEYGMHWV